MLPLGFEQGPLVQHACTTTHETHVCGMLVGCLTYHRLITYMTKMRNGLENGLANGLTGFSKKPN